MKLKNIAFITLLFITIESSAQRDWSMVPYRSGDKWGYATTDKKVVIAPKFADAGWFSEGYAPVKIGNRYGYINRSGKLVIPAKFYTAKSFRKGYMPNNKEGGDSVLFAGASLDAKGYEICIDTKGNRMPKCPAINETSAAENSTPVKTVVREKTYSLPNNDGLFDKIVDDYKVDGSDETYYIAKKGDRYGVFNSKFETIVPFQYNSVEVKRNDKRSFLQVNQGGMYGIMSPTGTMSIAPEYSNLDLVTGNDGKEYVIIKKEGKSYVKDINNTDIISTGFSNIEYDPEGGFVITGDNDTRGYYFMDNHVIQPRYKNVKMLNGGQYLMVTTTSGKTGYISATGEEYFVD